MAGLARLLAPTLDLPNHVQRLEVPREPPLEEDEPALAQLRGDIDALGDEPFDNGLAPVVDDTDAPLAALEAGANVGSDHRHFLLAPVVLRCKRGPAGRAAPVPRALFRSDSRLPWPIRSRGAPRP